jgi:hypothetical protein
MTDRTGRPSGGGSTATRTEGVMNTSFAAIVSYARRDSGLTAAEFDYQLNRGTELGANAYRGLGNALSVLGRSEGLTQQEMADRFGDDIDRMVADAKTKRYTGWSSASRGPIRYAR